MKFTTSVSLALFGFAGLAQSALAQLSISSTYAKGINYGVETKFTFTVNPADNTLTIFVDNTKEGLNGYRGTITSFGFNTPFTDALLGNNGRNVSFSQVWDEKVGRHSTTKWNKFEPYYLPQNGGYAADLGVGTGHGEAGGSTQNGIHFGEQVTFKFQLPNFGPADSDRFFDLQNDLVVRWQEVGNNDCDDRFSDFGVGDLPPAPEPSTYGLMGAAALLGIVGLRRRSQKNSAAKREEATVSA